MNPKNKALQNAKKPTLILTPKPKQDLIIPQKNKVTPNLSQLA